MKYHDGSSVSTALAAGLASLIMYCTRLADYHMRKEQSQDKSELTIAVERLQERNCMKKVLDGIQHDRWPEKKYLPVWSIFTKSDTGKIKDRIFKWEDVVTLAKKLNRPIME